VATDRYVTMTQATCDLSWLFSSCQATFLGDTITTIIVMSIFIGIVQGNNAMRKVCVAGG
jgi:hypothetical protein